MRLSALQAILTLDAAARQADPPAGDRLATLLVSWQTILTAIPDDHLGRILLRALQTHDSAFALTTGDVLTTWTADQAARAATPLPPRRPALPPAVGDRAPNCLLCAGTGVVGQDNAECPQCWGSGQVCRVCRGGRLVVRADQGRVGEQAGGDRYTACPACASGPGVSPTAQRVSGAGGPAYLADRLPLPPVRVVVAQEVPV